MEPEPRMDGMAVDAAIAQALAAGDPSGLERAYRRYADRLHAYCRSVVHDSEAAADAVHDTFVVASQRAGELRDPSRLRAWLYAVARNECLRILRARRRQAPLDEAAAVSAEAVDLGAGLRAEEIRELVHTASAGLTDGDREVIELALRHDLSAADVGAVLGMSANHAHARLSRARTQLEKSLGALLVARTGAEECGELRTLLAGWDGQLTALLRKRLARHIASCQVCEERQRRQLQPSALLSGYAALPFALVGGELWTRLRLTCGDAGAAGGAGTADARQIAARAGRFSRATGFPLPLDRRRGVLAWRMAAAAGLVLVIGAVALVAPRTDALLWHAPTATSVPTSTTSSAAPDPTAPTASPSKVPGSTAPPTHPPSPRGGVSPSLSPASPPALTVTARGATRCPSTGWIVYVAAQVAGAEPDAVTLHWQRSDGVAGQASLRRDGATWYGNTGALPPTAEQIQWRVSATTGGGGRGQSAVQTANASDCGRDVG